ncbi:hypothetical protein OSB04_018436 [Centaurea solstitialis]|uniref:PLAC8 motif-containing protein n=1 Tax=Centaurea solstitialis TaxID=347529 RepID=A0AA38WMZ7_9ASTR|nr:hypothetical protein OSB04_018436 [Centaurea solstitialis]
MENKAPQSAANGEATQTQQPSNGPPPPPNSNANNNNNNNQPQDFGTVLKQQGFVVGAPPQQVNGPAWTTGLFDCFEDPQTLIITFFAPCVTFAQIAEMVDRGRTSCGMFALVYALIMYFTGCGCLLSAYFRIKMSHIYNLPNDPLINILVHLLCEPCALCQEYRELQHHGFNMQLGVGWHNQTPEVQQIGAPTNPPNVPNGMSRN